MMKRKTILILAALGALDQSHGAVPITLSGTPTITWDTTPSGADWASVSVAGNGAALADLGTMDTTMTAALAWPTTATNWTVAANSTANEPTTNSVLAGIRFVTSTKKMLTGPTGNMGHALIGKFQNTSTSALASVDLDWTLGNPVAAVSTELPGVVTYYSIQQAGSAGSTNWIRVGENVSAAGAAPTQTLNFATPIAPNQFVYIAWFDDNANSGNDGNFTVSGISISNVVTSTLPTITASASAPTRNDGGTPGNPADDTVSFAITVVSTGSVSSGWNSTTAGFTSTGSYNTPRNYVNVPIASFGAGGSAVIEVKDNTNTSLTSSVTVVAPAYPYLVNATTSQIMDFAPATLGATSYVPPTNSLTQPGWSGGTTGATGSNVQVQVTGSLGTPFSDQHYHIESAGSPLWTSDPLNVAALAGQSLDVTADLAFYSTSNTGLDANDSIRIEIEVAADGNFANTAGTNITTASVYSKTVPAGTAAPGDTANDLAAIPDDNPTDEILPHINVTTFPETEFEFHTQRGVIVIPSGATNARARLKVTAVGISSSEHLLLDNIVFSRNTSPTLTTALAAGGSWNNQGTVAPDDDTYSSAVTITALNLGTSTGWNGNLIPATGNYGANPVLFGPFLANSSPVSLTLTDRSNASVSSVPLSLAAPAKTLTATLVAGSITRSGDDVSFQAEITGANLGPNFAATVPNFAGEPSLSSVTAADTTYAASGPKTVSFTISNAPSNGNVTVTIADVSYPTTPAPVSLTVAVPAATTRVLGQKDFGTGLSNVLVDTATVVPAAWLSYSSLRSTVVNAGGTAEIILDSEVIDLASVGDVQFSAKLRVHENSTGSNFEIGDKFKIELVIDGTPVSLITSASDTGDGASSAGANGPANGFLNGYTAADAADYDLNFDRDEFNITDPKTTAEGSLSAEFTFTHTIPAAANSVVLRLTESGFSGSEILKVSDVLFTTNTGATDSDSDGMPDSYETANGLNPNSNTDRNLDKDGDGASNYQEYIAGTSANNPSSVLKATVTPIAGGYSLSINSVVGKTYSLFSSSSLTSPSWTQLGTSVTATSTTTSVTIPAAAFGTAQRQFLQVRVQ